MPSLDERREVAARLREHAKTARRVGYACVLKNCVSEKECDSLGIAGCEGCFNKSLKRLADLIEPSERTCTMRYYPASNLWRCSECVGATHAERTLDEPPVYCQWCGSRVIQYE